MIPETNMNLLKWIGICLRYIVSLYKLMQFEIEFVTSNQKWFKILKKPSILRFYMPPLYLRPDWVLLVHTINNLYNPTFFLINFYAIVLIYLESYCICWLSWRVIYWRKMVFSLSCQFVKSMSSQPVPKILGCLLIIENNSCFCPLLLFF